MNTRVCMAALLATGLIQAGCGQRDPVKKEVQDLEKAERNSPNVAQDLERKLNDAKAEVAKLEEKLTLAKQGITDEVLKERSELKTALKNQERRVNKEINEAKGAAREHNADTERAEQLLQKTQPAQQIQTEVQTQTKVTPSENAVQVKKEQQTVPIEKSRIVEQKAKETPPPPEDTQTK